MAEGDTAPPGCQVCGAGLDEFLDLGRQPLSDRFVRPEDIPGEFFYRLAVGRCVSCGMAQLVDQVPREAMFHADYPYHSSGSEVMREHFRSTAEQLVRTELRSTDPFLVEIGCNDGVMLRTVSAAGVRQLGFEPSRGVADIARLNGVDVVDDFFEESTAARVRESHGPADVIYAANTLCHIPYIASVFKGVDALLRPDGVFVFEDPYLGDILRKNSYDQIYDEHFYFFTARSVQAMARQFGFELVNVQRLAVHGGEVRYTLAHAGARRPLAAVAELLAEEDANGVSDRATLDRFRDNVAAIREGLVATLKGLREQGRRVVAYGATAKSATVTNYCGIGSDLVSFVCDTTPAKQGLLTPGTHIPVLPAGAFADPYPDYALLFAWNHAEEIMAKEQAFRAAGGKWILYVPDVHLA